MFNRHEELFRHGFRVITIPPREYRPSKMSLESREFIDATYLEGERARAGRLPQSACPYSVDDPASHNWRRGWMGARLAEVETPLLGKSLHRAGFKAPRRSIEQLDAQHRIELADWLEAATDEATLQANRPSWVQLEPQDGCDASTTTRVGLRVLSFAIPHPLPCPQDEVDEEEERPRLRELPPATREEALLQDLLRQFDDLGVQLVEEQWQSLSDQDQGDAIDWLNDRLADGISPIPASLVEFATTALRDEPHTTQPHLP